MGISKVKTERGDKSMLIAVICKFADVKLLLPSLLLLCSIATLIHLLPPLIGNGGTGGGSAVGGLIFSASGFRPCLEIKPFDPPLNASTSRSEKLGAEANGVVKRTFTAVGSAAYLFVLMGAYRGGARTFAAVGLASKPLHVFSNPQFFCEWIPNGKTSNRSSAILGHKILPDWGYGRVYTVVVVNCTFPSGDVGAGGSGGRLVIHAFSGEVVGNLEKTPEEQILALEEAPGIVNLTTFTAPPKYDYLYCGSPLYGNLSPQRVREWVAYHARLFGVGRSHFVIHDAGGVHDAVVEVLRPWMELGMVTLQDVREQERFDGYYHNQFLVVNDCLHRYRHSAKWIFFFDLDEFIHVEPKTNLRSVMNSLSGYTQFTFDQMPMSGNLCFSSDYSMVSRMWGFEKLVYRETKRVARRDRKYAIQPRNAFAAGVHMSQDLAGRTLRGADRRIRYFHYHDTIAIRREPCREFTNATDIAAVDGTPYTLDTTLRRVAGVVRLFEIKTIGHRLRRTRQ